jgi:hypothetical protein
MGANSSKSFQQSSWETAFESLQICAVDVPTTLDMELALRAEHQSIIGEVGSWTMIRPSTDVLEGISTGKTTKWGGC